MGTPDSRASNGELHPVISAGRLQRAQVDEASPAQLNSEKARCLGKSMTSPVARRSILRGCGCDGRYGLRSGVWLAVVTITSIFAIAEKRERCGVAVRAWNWTPQNRYFYLYRTSSARHYCFWPSRPQSISQAAAELSVDKYSQSLPLHLWCCRYALDSCPRRSIGFGY